MVTSVSLSGDLLGSSNVPHQRDIVNIVLLMMQTFFLIRVLYLHWAL
jgi:hypothetical protein